MILVDLSRPLAAVVPSMEGPVLEALARRSSPMTGREVHRLAGSGSESGVRLVLSRLVEHGLVTASQAGRATLYVGNRDHLAWLAVETLVSLRQEFMVRMSDLVGSWALEPETVMVFGSAARGDGDTASDIDVLVVRRQMPDAAWQAQVDDLRERVVAWTGNLCQVYELSVEEFDEHVAAEEPIVADWRRDGVVVFGRPLREVVAAGSH